jgi:hypothetical protein
MLLALALGSGCGEQSTRPLVNFHATGTASGEIGLQGETTLRCVSTKGQVTVQGEGLDLVRWYIYRYAAAPTQERANDALARIVAEFRSAGDTLVFDVGTPPSGDVYYYGAVTLGIPSWMNCVVSGATAPALVSDLSGALTVTGAGSVTVARHTGSCDVSVTRGGLALEIAVPESGYCLGRTQDGSIRLRLPASSSAHLEAHTDAGTVTVTGLALADRVDSPGFVSGTLGSGTAVVRLETKRGNIEVIGLAP